MDKRVFVGVVAYLIDNVAAYPLPIFVDTMTCAR
jgi:hypothetical protein